MQGENPFDLFAVTLPDASPARPATPDATAPRTLDDALAALDRSRGPSAIVLQASPSHPATIDALTRLRARSDSIPIVVIGDWREDERVLDAVRAGADDCIPHDGPGTWPSAARAARVAAERHARIARALERAGERMDLVIRGSSDGIWDWDVRTDQVYFSPSWKSMLGYQDHELENRFETWENLLHPEDRHRALLKIEDYFAGRSKHFELEHRLRHKDGSYRWILARGAAIHDGDGHPTRMVGTHVDLTERKATEEELRKAYAEQAAMGNTLHRALLDLRDSHRRLKSTQRELIRAARRESIGALAAGVAHEVKNPLQTVLMGLAYLSNNLPPGADPSLHHVLADTREAVRRADAIVRELLQLAVVTRIDVAPANLNAILRSCMEMLQYEIAAGRFHLVAQLDAGAPDASLDRRRMEQAFVNLMLNALQAMPQGGTLTVRTRAAIWAAPDSARPAADVLHIDPGDRVVLAEIEDTGPGIPQDLRERIFEPFFTTRHDTQGAGLGLAVVKQIVDVHGGAIRVDDAPGGGARVTVILRAEPDAIP